MNDAIGLYLNDIGKVALLTAEDERTLSKAIEKGREAAALYEAGEKLIKELRIKTKNSQNPVTSLSGGNQQRVVLAKWLAMNPHLMILNGPTVGVDIGSKREILEIIRDRAQEGMAFLVVSDDIPELIQICHRVMVIKNGQVSKEFNESELDETVLYKELS